MERNSVEKKLEERKEIFGPTKETKGERKRNRKQERKKPETQKVNEQILSLIKYTDPTFSIPLLP